MSQRFPASLQTRWPETLGIDRLGVLDQTLALQTREHQLRDLGGSGQTIRYRLSRGGDRQAMCLPFVLILGAPLWALVLIMFVCCVIGFIRHFDEIMEP